VQGTVRTGILYTLERAVFYKLQDAVRPRALDQGVSTCLAHAHTYRKRRIGGLEVEASEESGPEKHEQEG
jgi:hypothetical protein